MISTPATLAVPYEAGCSPVTEGAAEEAEWVRAAQAGRSDAILSLLGRYRPQLVRLLTGLVGDAGSAEDLAQESFLQAFRSLKQLRDPAAFYPWVRRLATRQALRGLRRKRPDMAADALEMVSVDGPARQVETRLAVEAVLASLAPELRAVLVLRELEQLDYEEIAETLEIPIGTVRSRLFKARERFRQGWTDMEGAQ
jgi:RNA polymerase sigma-70 factor (ECF subfamily)